MISELSARAKERLLHIQAIYQRLRSKKQGEIDEIKELLLDSELEISNLDSYIEKSIEISQNIHKYWQLGGLDEQRKIQKMVFHEGIVVDTTNRTYLTWNWISILK